MVTLMIMSNNNHEMLIECLNRIKQFTDIPYELVIVDDASDPSYDLDATIVRMPLRSDCCNLRNVGMAMSKTDLVFWLDNDTMVSEGWYKPLLDKMNSDPKIGLVGQPKDSRLVRKPFLPLTQRDSMVENQFHYDFNHLNGECDYITSYCVLVRKAAFRPTHCYGMPTPMLDPELGAGIKANGYKVVVADTDCNVTHIGSATPRPGGKDYLYHLAENFTKWFNFWESHKIFELYKGKAEFNHDANEPDRAASLGTHGDLDL